MSLERLDLRVRSGAPYMSIDRMNGADVGRRCSVIKRTVGSVISSSASASFIILRVSLIKYARNYYRIDLCSGVNTSASVCLAASYVMISIAPYRCDSGFDASSKAADDGRCRGGGGCADVRRRTIAAARAGRHFIFLSDVQAWLLFPRRAAV
ncbi:hypothetical protein ROHU_016179 [Labeo rohita]|uniref:Uncharacterized protein n=1 Tax=Labeo rohita TaxID=84645 RepID=A0A498NKR0_LABRO|nr:hypothetical protein ROHU_016179 [Labeo rohita]